MKARKLLLTIIALLVSVLSMTAFAQGTNPKDDSPVQTIDGKWNASTVGSPIGEIKFDIIITKTDEGYKASVPGYVIENVSITEKTLSCTTSTMGMTVDIFLYLTDKGTLEGDAMGIGIVAQKEAKKEAEKKEGQK